MRVETILHFTARAQGVTLFSIGYSNDVTSRSLFKLWRDSKYGFVQFEVLFIKII